MTSVSEKYFDTIDRILDFCEWGLIAVLSVAALGLGTMQVFLRYVFGTGFHWNEAVFVLCTVTAMLAAGVRAVREDAHVRVDLMQVLVPARAGQILDMVSYTASLALCAFYAYCGYLFVVFAKMMDTTSPETGFKDWMVFSIMPVVMAAFVLRYILKIRDAYLGKPSPHTTAEPTIGDAE